MVADHRRVQRRPRRDSATRPGTHKAQWLKCLVSKTWTNFPVTGRRSTVSHEVRACPIGERVVGMVDSTRLIRSGRSWRAVECSNAIRCRRLLVWSQALHLAGSLNYNLFLSYGPKEPAYSMLRAN